MRSRFSFKIVFLIGLSVILLFGCKKETSITGPKLTTSGITSIEANSAISGGEISSDGGTAITIRGVCWNSGSSAPTISDSKTIDGSGTGVYISSLTGLSSGTKYRLRAYATSSAGTNYGNELSFSTPVQFLQQGNKLFGSGGAGNYATQGTSVSISSDGNTAIIGGPYDNKNYSGSVWFYTRSNGIWAQQGNKLTDINAGLDGGLNAHQGHSVSLSGDGNTAIVGSRFNGVSFYIRSGGIWTQQGTRFSGTGAAGEADQGSSVAISADGNTAIIGGLQDDSGSGAVWIFTRSNGIWAQQGSKLTGTGASGKAAFGKGIALSADGNTAIVGGPFDTSNQGAVWIFTRNNGVWNQQGNKLIGSGALGAANQGFSVSLSADGNTAMTGGPLDKNGGAVWIFVRSNGTWAQQGDKLAGTGSTNGTQLGKAVSLSSDGNTAIVGGPFDNNYQGAAWIYSRNNGIWTQQMNKLIGSGSIGPASQGAAVSLSGDGKTAIIGGESDNNNQGAAWIFVSN